MANSKKINLIIILIYFTLVFGFFYGEDTIGGAFNDYNSHAHIAEKFRSNFRAKFHGQISRTNFRSKFQSHTFSTNLSLKFQR